MIVLKTYQLSRTRIFTAVFISSRTLVHLQTTEAVLKDCLPNQGRGCPLNRNNLSPSENALHGKQQTSYRKYTISFDRRVQLGDQASKSDVITIK